VEFHHREADWEEVKVLSFGASASRMVCCAHEQVLQEAAVVDRSVCAEGRDV
jgi:hypothetical protein